MKRYASEDGQALILLVLAFTVLLGFTALAIDGGMVYSNRRHAQNAADASSLAGAGAAALILENNYVNYDDWSCSDPRVISAQQDSVAGAKVVAISSANSNDYTIDTDISDKNGVQTICGNASNGSFVDKYLDIRTLITTDTKTAFAQFVYKGPLRNTVEAVTRVRPQAPLAFGNAMVALSNACLGGTGGVNFVGTSGSNVTGGGIFSNACVTANGAASIDVDPGDTITCVGTDCASKWSPASGPTPKVSPGTLPDEYVNFPPPDCSSLPNLGSHNGGGTIDPGKYYQIRVNSSSDHLVLNPGLYCLSNGLVMNGGSIVGNDVTFYLTGGDFNVSGSNFVNLSAPPTEGCTVCPPAMGGVLLYMAEGNNGVVSLLGSSQNGYLGLVYAPNGTINVAGTADEVSEVSAQLVAGTINIQGTAELIIRFDNNTVYQLPAMVELSK